jgi:excinuclease ABC subunit C
MDYPREPGVYIMKNEKGRVLYIGKAKNLDKRIKQYFSGHDKRPQIPFLIEQVADIEVILVLSEREALILENNLIKKHQPKYNICLKDDKGNVGIQITKHRWPVVKLVRHRESKGSFFGPYTSVRAARHVLALLKKFFPLRQCSDRKLGSQKNPCLYHQMGCCLAPCAGLCSIDEYADNVKRVIHFLKGNTSKVVVDLEVLMQEASGKMEYERAAIYLRMIQGIKQTIGKQNVEDGFGDEDTLGIYREGSKLVVTCLMMRGGKVIGCDSFEFQGVLQDDENVLCSFILQRYADKVDPPAVVVVPMDIGKDLWGAVDFKIVLPKHGRRKERLKIAHINAKAAFVKKQDEIHNLSLLQNVLGLTHCPETIVCFDIAHIAGTDSVGVAVSFVGGLPNKKDYRKYRIKHAKAGDDYAGMAEILGRHYSHLKKRPDLIIVDGGLGHLNAAVNVLDDIDVISIAKEKGSHAKGLTSEKIFVPGKKKPIVLERHDPILFLLQKIRDEAHRFAITWHRESLSKKNTRSKLEDLPGIGPAKSKSILRHFGSVKKTLNASYEELKKVPGLSEKDIERLRSLEANR